MRPSSGVSNANESDDGVGVAASADGSSRSHKHRPQRRAFGLLAVALVASVLAGAVFAWAQTRPPLIGFRPLPYRFVWQHPAPGALSPQQAYEQEGRVASASALTAPAATLWVAQTDDAALALTLLAPGPLDREHLAVVMLERTGGVSGTWTADAQPSPGRAGCGAASGYCLQIAEHALVHQIEGFGSVNSASASGIFVRFAEPLAGPVQGGVLDATSFYAASGTPSDDANAALVLLGSSSQTQVDAAAAWLAAQP